MCPNSVFIWKHVDLGRHWSIDIISSGFIQHSNKMRIVRKICRTGLYL